MSESLNTKYKTLKAKLRNDRLKATENRNARQKEIADVRKTKRRIQYAARREACKLMRSVGVQADETSNRRCNDDTLNSLQMQRPSSAVHTGVVQARSNKRKCTEGSKRTVTKVTKVDSLEEERRRVRERVQKFRNKLTEEAKEKIRAKDREYRRQRKVKKLDKSISEMSKKEQRQQRKRWSAYAKAYRERKRLLAASHATVFCVAEDDSTPVTPAPVSLGRASSSRKLVGRRRVSIGRSKMVRELLKSKEELKKKERQLQQMKVLNAKYRQRLCRTTKGKMTPSPGTKVRKITAGKKITPQIRKRLLFAEILATSVSNRKNQSNRSDSQVQVKAIASSLFRKYKLTCSAAGYFGYNFRTFSRAMKSKHLKYDSRCLNRGGVMKEAKQVQQFLEDDRHTRIHPGKKDHKKKIQKRILLYTMKELHLKYKAQFKSSISYSSFLRLRPCWIVQPRVVDRETCACIKCANIQFVVSKLHQLKMLAFDRAEKLCPALCCDKKRKECMYRQCVVCRDNMVAGPVSESEQKDDVSYFQWKNATESRMIKGKAKEITFMQKAVINTTKNELTIELMKLAEPYMRHIFVKEHQQDEICKKKSEMKENETIIQVDFSENYVLKYAEETQAMHFGASKVQLSLHTGVQYLFHANTGKTFVKSFGTASTSLDHGAHAVWAHLTPILRQMSRDQPGIDTVHFVSDGPSAQYRNRFNAFLLVSYLKDLCPAVKRATWNFSEAGHGKGPMDGVGGTLKRVADEHVARGNDISSVGAFVSHVSVSCPGIDVFEVLPGDIQRSKLLLPKKVSAVPGIMEVHQMSWDSSHPTTVFVRSLSCFTCQFGTVCDHYRVREGKSKVTFNVPSVSVDSDQTPEAAGNTADSMEVSDMQMNDLVTDVGEVMSQSLDLVDAADQSDDTVVANVQLNDLVEDPRDLLSTLPGLVQVAEAADVGDADMGEVMSQLLDLVDAADQSDDAVVADVQLNDLVGDVILHLSTSLSPIRVPEAADISAEQNINEEDTGQPANLTLSTSPTHVQTVDEDDNVLSSSQHNLVIPTSFEQLSQGSWISVIYGRKWYPGIIENICSNAVTVKFMQRSRDRDKFVWPRRTDVQDVEMNDILCILPAAPVAESATKFIIPGADDIELLLRSSL